jgi:hypothetical protein
VKCANLNNFWDLKQFRNNWKSSALHWAGLWPKATSLTAWSPGSRYWPQGGVGLWARPNSGSSGMATQRSVARAPPVVTTRWPRARRCSDTVGVGWPVLMVGTSRWHKLEGVLGRAPSKGKRRRSSPSIRATARRLRQVSTVASTLLGGWRDRRGASRHGAGASRRSWRGEERRWNHHDGERAMGRNYVRPGRDGGGRQLGGIR